MRLQFYPNGDLQPHLKSCPGLLQSDFADCTWYNVLGETTSINNSLFLYPATKIMPK